MLNDAVKERERVMEVAAETESLERLVGDGDTGLQGRNPGGPHTAARAAWLGGVPRRGSSLPALPPAQVAEVSPRLEALRCSAEALARDTAQAESGFTTVKSEKDLPGLQGLQSRQQEMEVSPGEPRGRPGTWRGGVWAGWGCPGEALAPGGPGVVSLGALRRLGWNFPARAREGEKSLRQLPCASARLPAPRSSFRRRAGDSGGQSGRAGKPHGENSASPCHPQHPEPFFFFLPFWSSACGIGDPAGAAGGAGAGSCPLARALPCSPVPRRPGGAGHAAGVGRAAGAAAEDPCPRAAGRPAAALLQGLPGHDVSGDEPTGLSLRRGSCWERGVPGAGDAHTLRGQCWSWEQLEPEMRGCARSGRTQQPAQASP